ncbi:hypothetical protein PUNSTDRAFT_53086 [Punctularia strigosozonata HHB-11173 SS5]|uniref:uncharacterized protein n=1 Tax=Punctularia strigosozonata (strain HHB-11173) TaxID=741275 RepID=UPI0004416948|nr:uncharacterized protein PUNSTDRAFT_53086 [Punctularia strigosozonata HHB-11173 SS5]EIN07691.1 hypothetical protein PUNSTDRAFT_53086 [Punctularia strigosozonata HHB-11173 SS5]
MVQLAVYASEMLSVRGLIRTHAIGAVVQDHWVWLWYFDSSGAIQSQGFSIVAHTPIYILLLMMYQRFDLTHWGIPPEVNSRAQRDLAEHTVVPKSEMAPKVDHGRNTRSRAVQALDFFTVTARKFGDEGDEKVMRVYPSRRVFASDRAVLKGRRTTVVEAEDPDAEGVAYVAKWSFPQTQRPSEVDVVRKAYEIGQDNPEVVKHLPTVVAYRDYHEFSTDRIRSRLRRCPQGGQEGEALSDDSAHGAPRVLRVVFEKRLKPIQYLTGKQLLKALWQIMKCHHLLWQGDSSHAIEHGDISLNNLAVDPDTLGGVLRDFDLSRIRDKNEESAPQGTERTGTVPFMALELLCDEYWEGKIERLYRHDVESFAWVIIYLGFTNDETLETLPAVDWYTADYEDCRGKKLKFLSSWKTVTDVAHIVYGSRQPWLLAMDLALWTSAVSYEASRDILTRHRRTTTVIASKSREDIEADRARENTELLNVFAERFMQNLDLPEKAFNEWLKAPADDACRRLHQDREAKQLRGMKK